jgi:hypothetical protein
MTLQEERDLVVCTLPRLIEFFRIHICYLLKGWCESDVKNSISLGTVTLSTQGVV